MTEETKQISIVGGYLILGAVVLACLVGYGCQQCEMTSREHYKTQQEAAKAGLEFRDGNWIKPQR